LTRRGGRSESLKRHYTERWAYHLRVLLLCRFRSYVVCMYVSLYVRLVPPICHLGVEGFILSIKIWVICLSDGCALLCSALLCFASHHPRWFSAKNTHSLTLYINCYIYIKHIRIYICIHSILFAYIRLLVLLIHFLCIYLYIYIYTYIRIYNRYFLLICSVSDVSLLISSTDDVL